jgi:hypothetical protein
MSFNESLNSFPTKFKSTNDALKDLFENCDYPCIKEIKEETNISEIKIVEDYELCIYEDFDLSDYFSQDEINNITNEYGDFFMVGNTYGILTKNYEYVICIMYIRENEESINVFAAFILNETTNERVCRKYTRH